MIRSNGLVLGLLAAALIALGLVAHANADAATTTASWSVDTLTDLPVCEPLLITENVSASTVAELKAAGWYANPADGLEALYSPDC